MYVEATEMLVKKNKPPWDDFVIGRMYFAVLFQTSRTFYPISIFELPEATDHWMMHF